MKVLDRIRQQYGFAVVGYVVMPEHFHLLISEPTVGNPSTVMQVLKQLVAREVLTGRTGPPFPAKPAGKSGAPTKPLSIDTPIYNEKEQHFWMKRFYDFNVWSHKKRQEKLDYMHMNPVERGLVMHPADWPWSSYRFYALGDSKMLAIDWKWPEE